MFKFELNVVKDSLVIYYSLRSKLCFFTPLIIVANIMIVNSPRMVLLRNA